MILRPCLRCPHKEGCEIREYYRNALRGMKLTTVSFSCKKRTKDLQPGTRVILHNEGIWAEAGDIQGTVSGLARHNRMKLAVWLDESLDPGGHISIVRVFPDMLEPLDAPRVAVCPECGRPEGYQNKPSWVCSTCGIGAGVQ